MFLGTKHIKEVAMSKKLVLRKQIDALENILSTLQDSELKESHIPSVLTGLEIFTEILRKRYSSIADIIQDHLKKYKQPESYLAKILGSRSRASELIAGKRTPSLADMRALKTHLGISADLLLLFSESSEGEMDFSQVPVAELVKRKWIPQEFKKQPEEALKWLASESGSSCDKDQPACFRQGARKNSKTNPYALQAWLMYVRYQAQSETVDGTFTYAKATKLLSCIAQRLSASSSGVSKVKEELSKIGIKFLVIPHLKGTHLDGAVFFDDKTPIIALTIRYDRLDNFWYTLLHELAHLSLKHVSVDSGVIFDDLDISPHDTQELEADILAQSSAIPEDKWHEFMNYAHSHSDIYDFALSLGISPAIVAGRVRYETKSYRKFTSLVGHGMVRKQFMEVFEE